MSVQPAGTERPVLRVISGNPTAEEIAAIIAVVSAVSGMSGAAARQASLLSGQTSLWADHERLLNRMPMHLPAPGPMAWRASMLP